MKKKLKTIVWILVGLLAIFFLLIKTDWTSLKDAVQNIAWGWVIWAVTLYYIAQTLLATRWVLLLRVQGVFVSVFQAIKLTYLGLFYNNMMPGAVGGDLLKGWYITHHCDKSKRLEAAVTVFVDRIIGLVGMILVGAIASMFAGSGLKITLFGHSISVQTLILGLFASLVIGATIFLSKRIRRGLMISQLLEKLPFKGVLNQIDSALRLYRNHIGSVLLSLLLTAVIQGLSIVAVWMLTQALHLDRVAFIQCLIIMPIVWLISAAIPVPGGLGVMENLFIPFFMAAAAPVEGLTPENEVALRGTLAALALLNRLMICFCSLPGALVPIFGGHLPKANELAEMQLDQDEVIEEDKL